MTLIVTILTDGYADWETALLNAAARQYVGFSATEIERQRDRSQAVELPDLQGMME